MDMTEDERIDDILKRQSFLEGERSTWETTWREVDERVNPLGQGGFFTKTPGSLRGLDIFDHTATLGLDRFTAAITGMMFPRSQRWHGLETTDAALNAVPAVARWLERTTDRLFAMRYAPHAGFEPEAGGTVRSLGSYGTGALWVDEWIGRGMFYKTIHMSEIYLDEDFRGRVDTVHRKFSLKARQWEQRYGRANLSPTVAKALDDKRPDAEFDCLHVVRPRADRDPERLDFRAMAYESIHIAMADKKIVREGGYRSMPMITTRYVNGPREKYGRSPAMQVLGTIRTANEIERTMLRASHKAVDPPLLVPEDGVLSQIQTMPGGINVGGMDMQGRPAVMPMQQGGQLAIGLEMLQAEREVIGDAFLEKVFTLMMQPRDRMTATEVLEISRLQGMLLAPTAGRQEAELLGPMIERELDIAIEAKQIDPPPPELIEAGGRVRVIYDNPLSRAARAEEALGFGRFVEMLVPIASQDPSVWDVIDSEQAPRNLASALAVRPSYLRDPEAVADMREKRDAEKQGAQTLAALPEAAGAVADLAKARSLETAVV